MNKKIIVSMFAIVAVATIAAVGSSAYWVDEEGFNSSIEAGSLDLELNGVPIKIENVIPGQTGEHTLHIKNTGSVAGDLTFAMDAVKNLENDCIEPEKNDANPIDSTCGTGDDQGELGDNVNIVVAVRDYTNSAAVFTNVISDMTLTEFIAAANGNTPYSGVLDPNADLEVKITWTVNNQTPESDNIFMTDSFEADFKAVLTQVGYPTTP